MSRIRLGILTDNRVLGEGLRRILGADPDVGLVGVLQEPTGFLAVGSADGPEVLLVDAQAPEYLQWCSQLAHSATRPSIVLISVAPDSAGAVEGLRAGARGIVCKGATAEQLMTAIHVVHEGVVWAPQAVLERALDSASGRQGAALDSRLTRRELEIARDAATGLTNKEIAGRLSISEATVKAHLSSIFRKLKVRDRMQLVFLYLDPKRSASLTP
jgi:DNA-binding NarL/FixJ family response regulator